MQEIDDEFDNGSFSKIKESIKSAKEDLLDETFKKAEIKKALRLKEEKKTPKKPFLKLGIILIVISLIAIITVNSLPWVFIKYDTINGTTQESYFKDFTEGTVYKGTNYIFESPCSNCSNKSNNFIGLTINDFSDVPRLTIYAFIILGVIGFIFSFFLIIDKWRNFSIDVTLMVHSTFAIIASIISVYVIYILTKFLGSHFLLYYNEPFIEASGIENIALVYPTTSILFILSFTIIMVTIVILQINFREFEKKLLFEKTRSGRQYFKVGSKP
jgi:hypothetical protein